MKIILIIRAWIEFLQDHFNACAVQVDDDYKVVYRRCGNCRHKNTNMTKYCYAASSLGCGKWEYDNATI